MKNLVITILVSLILAPPLQAHNDVVIYEDVESHTDIDSVHEDIHHKNDSHDEKEKKLPLVFVYK